MGDTFEDICNAYENRKSVEKFCYASPISEVRDNDYNLNIPRYVDTYKESERYNLDEIKRELSTINKEIARNNQVIDELCRKMGV